MRIANETDWGDLPHIQKHDYGRLRANRLDLTRHTHTHTHTHAYVHARSLPIVSYVQLKRYICLALTSLFAHGGGRRREICTDAHVIHIPVCGWTDFISILCTDDLTVCKRSNIKSLASATGARWCVQAELAAVTLPCTSSFRTS